MIVAFSFLLKIDIEASTYRAVPLVRGPPYIVPTSSYWRPERPNTGSSWGFVMLDKEHQAREF